MTIPSQKSEQIEPLLHHGEGHPTHADGGAPEMPPTTQAEIQPQGFSLRALAATVLSKLRRADRVEPPPVEHTAMSPPEGHTLSSLGSLSVEAPLAAEQDGLSNTAERFWHGEGYAEPAVTFTEQLDELAVNPDARSNLIAADPTEIWGRYGISAARTKATFTEAEAMKDLDDFLRQVTTVAEGDHTDDGAAMLKQASEFRESVILMGAAEYAEACEGMAALWAEYVSQTPDHVINLYVRELDGSHQKSYTVVAQDIYNRFMATVGNTELAERVRLGTDNWTDTQHARLVVTDDWIASGNTMSKRLIDSAADAASNAGLAGLRDKIEAHLLIGREGQPRYGISEQEGIEYEYRSYSKGEGRISSDIQPLSGSHSSVDYGFELPLEEMQKYLARHGHQRETPLFVNVQRPYRFDPEMRDPQALALLAEATHVNAQITALTNAVELMQAAPGNEATGGRTVALDQELQGLESLRYDLRSRYDARVQALTSR